MDTSAEILVVDDERVVCEGCRRVLEADGHHVQTVGTAERAIEVLTRHRFDLVLLDLKMPGCGGLTLLSRIRRVDPEAEIVVITGYPTVENAKASIRLGASEFFVKPFVPNTLRRLVGQILTCKPWKVSERCCDGY